MTNSCGPIGSDHHQPGKECAGYQRACWPCSTKGKRHFIGPPVLLKLTQPKGMRWLPTCVLALFDEGQKAFHWSTGPPQTNPTHNALGFDQLKPPGLAKWWCLAPARPIAPADGRPQQRAGLRPAQAAGAGEVVVLGAGAPDCAGRRPPARACRLRSWPGQGASVLARPPRPHRAHCAPPPGQPSLPAPLMARPGRQRSCPAAATPPGPLCATTRPAPPAGPAMRA